MGNDSEKTYYREVQSFRQVWLWLIIVLPAALFSFGFMKQIIYKMPFGSKPMSDHALIVIWLATLILPCVFYFCKLCTLVKKDGVYVRFIPFHFSYVPIPFSQVRKYEARTYSPVAEYGGWGIRYSGTHGKAYNVSGNQGIQFELDNGKRILIGTQKADEFMRAIDETIGHKE